jgi:hypothetical protein
VHESLAREQDGADGDFDAAGLAIRMASEPDIVENEAGKVLNRVQNGLNLKLNSWSPC